jgi:hypothetical protein
MKEQVIDDTENMIEETKSGSSDAESEDSV